jgi:hypothetical protein
MFSLYPSCLAPSSKNLSYFPSFCNFLRKLSPTLFADSILFSSLPALLSASNAVAIAANYIAVDVPPVVIVPPIIPPALAPRLIIDFHQEELDPPAIPLNP